MLWRVFVCLVYSGPKVRPSDGQDSIYLAEAPNKAAARKKVVRWALSHPAESWKKMSGKKPLKVFVLGAEPTDSVVFLR